MKTLWLVCIIVLLSAVAIIAFSSNQAAPPQVSLAQDAYPLYSGAKWSAPREERFVIGTTTFSGASITSSSISAGMDPASITVPFEQYYKTKLEALGWESANDLAAGGAVGGQTGYRKDGAIMLTRFSIDYATTVPNEPVQCPCDVTLSLFSGR